MKANSLCSSHSASRSLTLALVFAALLGIGIALPVHAGPVFVLPDPTGTHAVRGQSDTARTQPIATGWGAGTSAFPRHPGGAGAALAAPTGLPGVTVTLLTVPEPSSPTLVGIGLAAWAFFFSRCRRQLP